MAENREGKLYMPLIENLTSRREASQAMLWLSLKGPFPMPLAEEDLDRE